MRYHPCPQGAPRPGGAERTELGRQYGDGGVLATLVGNCAGAHPLASQPVMSPWSGLVPGEGTGTALDCHGRRCPEGVNLVLQGAEAVFRLVPENAARTVT